MMIIYGEIIFGYDKYNIKEIRLINHRYFTWFEFFLFFWVDGLIKIK